MKLQKKMQSIPQSQQSHQNSGLLYIQVRFVLIWGSKISYLTVHLYEKTLKDTSFDITLEQEEESDGRT